MALTAEDLKKDGHHDLAESLSLIPQFVNSWWRQTYLTWFTDHGPGHSQRVADYSLQIARIPDLPTKTGLTALEEWILWAAAWLHDLGMQSLLGERLGEISTSGYDRVRHEHPQRSADIIIERAKEIGLPADDVVLQEIVAMVARAHGTKYFKSSVSELRELTHVRNEQVRGPLLASILLMADEIDLDHRRVPNLPAEPTLNSISIAHSTKHRHVVACAVEQRPAGSVGFSVRLLSPAHYPADELVEIEKWIVEKLRTQMSMVEAEFVEGWGGFARLSRSVVVSYQPTQVGSPPMETAARRVVEAENRRADLINHEHTLRLIDNAIESRSTIILVGRLEGAQAGGFGTIDVDGREDLLESSLVQHACRGTLILGSHCLFETLGVAGAEDVLRELQAGLKHVDGMPLLSELRDDIATVLLEQLSEVTAPILIGVSSIDLLGVDEMTWMLDTFIPMAQEVADVSTIMTLSPGAADGITGMPAVIDSRGLDTDSVRNYLARYAPLATARAEAALGLRYSTYKALKQEHLATMAGF